MDCWKLVKKITLSVVSIALIAQITIPLLSAAGLGYGYRLCMVVVLYSLVLAVSFQHGKILNTLGSIKDSFVMSLLVFVYTCIPLLFHAVVPAVALQNDYYLYFSLNYIFSFCLVSLYYLLRFVGNGFAKIAILLVMHAVLIINSIYVAVVYETGFEFGPLVMHHASEELLDLVLKEYGVVIVVIIILTVSVAFQVYKQLLVKKEFKPGILTTSIALVAIVANVMLVDKVDYYIGKKTVPSLSLYDAVSIYNSKDHKETKEYLLSLGFRDSEIEILQDHGIVAGWEARPVTAPTKKKNVIIIYLESLQYELTRRGGWSGKPILPFIDNLSDKFTTFNNFYNSATPTINATISSQCGIDIEYEEDPDLSDADDLFDSSNKYKAIDSGYYESRLFCMPDILQLNGYTQAFMKGADMDFSHKRRFFKEHGYNELLGRDELYDETKHLAALNSWGLSDIDLFNEALLKLDELEKKQPFNLTVLTVNSHPPGFGDPRCPKYTDDNTLLNAFHCTDYALGKFIEELFKRELIENTYVFLLGDHSLFASSANMMAVEGKVPISWYGKTYLSIYSPNGDLPEEMDVLGYTPDFAATVLDLLGFKGVRFVNGKSLITERRSYQHLVAQNYEIKDGKIVQSGKLDRWNNCSREDIAATTITSDDGGYSACERAKIYAAQLKLLYTGHL
jgi:phosphoglycerol transferase MdoB-like AlkP superfamily enzyme